MLVNPPSKKHQTSAKAMILAAIWVIFLLGCIVAPQQRLVQRELELDIGGNPCLIMANICLMYGLWWLLNGFPEMRGCNGIWITIYDRDIVGKSTIIPINKWYPLIAGWFMSWKIPSGNGWLGVPRHDETEPPRSGAAGADRHRLLQRPGRGACQEDVDPGAVGHRSWDSSCGDEVQGIWTVIFLGWLWIPMWRMNLTSGR